ncbi:MFS transporter [Longilinea arvoryzae]|uniref:MFS transporter n=1 Tax=Longilinea arvoryzae TaxID=360412 RepID=UPI00126038E5|nr:MFS transporter [Longilinea arvoryzae]
MSTFSGEAQGGWLSDRRGRRFVIILGSIITILAFVSLIFASVLYSLIFLIISSVILGITSLSRPARRSATADSVPSTKLGSAFSIIMVSTMLSGSVAPTAGGWLIDHYGYAFLFLLLSIIEGVSILIIIRYKEEHPSKASKIEWQGIKHFINNLFVDFNNKRLLLIMTGLDAFSWGVGWGLLYGFISKEFGFQPTQIGIMASVMSLSWVIIQVPLGRLIDLFGPQLVMLFAQLVGIPLIIIWMTQSSIYAFVLSMIFTAFTGAAWQPAIDTYVSNHVSAEERAETFGKLSAFRDLCGFPAPLIGGALYQIWGFKAPLTINLLGVVLIVLIILLTMNHSAIRMTNA